MSEATVHNSKDSGAEDMSSRALGGLAKRIFDFSSALTLVILLAPLLLMVALLIIGADGRPFFIRHKRVGHKGAEFGCFKFRTMVRDADVVLAEYLLRNPAAAAQWTASRKLANDPRITPIGRVLRTSSLDELPQLFNILKGEMSLVGPRPIVRDETANYGGAFDAYVRTRPGPTGLWQVKGRSNTSYEERVRLDTEYVTSWSFHRDVVILLMTVPSVLAARGSM